MSPSVRLAAALGSLAWAAVLAGGGCGTRGAPVEAPVEIAVAPVPKTADGGGITSTGAAESCSVRLALAGEIERSSSTCYVDEHISKTAGVLRFPCSGEGAVDVDFGDHHYTGRVSGGEVELEVATELDWEDGCRWGTKAVISGRLVTNGRPTMKSLMWRYRDYVIDGTGCSAVCNALATLQVTSTAGRPAPPSAVRDPDDAD
jgi:hypothetical protein